MAYKVVDTVKPNGNFPVAETVDIDHNGENLSDFLDSISDTTQSEVYNGTFADLQADANAQSGKVYIVETSDPDVRHQYIKTNNTWHYIGTTQFNLGRYYTKAQIDAKLAQKQNALTAGDNIIIEDDTISAIGASPFANVRFEIDMSTGELMMIPDDSEQEVPANMAGIDEQGRLYITI